MEGATKIGDLLNWLHGFFIATAISTNGQKQ